ncbi:A-kinase anchor protein 1, mitochondrial-like [Gigantopelta aegis]|uniref:A-kinase anchor protein 1, mitochondrial-like n=1 Tax=Gigantopelta aegis TaxID=1735272 RepID=UPI001B88849B|nr:A-kinase anchor protein 1, mitochondrial-like [Gigantopelta aegis]XP_041349947.1 A-kinase anchor protein 1, mitochondrial-like [Gigantopelta aegis]
MANFRSVLAYALPTVTALLGLLWFFGIRKGDGDKITDRKRTKQRDKTVDHTASGDSKSESVKNLTEVKTNIQESVAKEVNSSPSQLSEEIVSESSKESFCSAVSVQDVTLTSDIKSSTTTPCQEQTALQDASLPRAHSDSQTNFAFQDSEQSLSSQSVCTKLPKHTSEENKHHQIISASNKSCDLSSVEHSSESYNSMLTSESSWFDVDSERSEPTVTTSVSIAQADIYLPEPESANKNTNACIETDLLSSTRTSEVPIITSNQNSSIPDATNDIALNISSNKVDDEISDVSSSGEARLTSVVNTDSENDSRCEKIVYTLSTIKSNTKVHCQPTYSNEATYKTQSVSSDKRDYEVSILKREVGISPLSDSSSEQNVFNQSATSSKSEVVASSKNEVFSNVESEVIANLESEVTANTEGEVIANTEGEVIANLESEVIANLESKVTANTEGEVIANLESEVIANTEGEVIANLESKVTANTEGEVIANLESEVIANLESGVIANSESGVVANSESGVIANSESGVMAKSESGVIANLESEVIANLESEVIANLESEVIANLESEVIANSESEVIANSDSEVIANLESEVIANSESGVTATSENGVVSEYEDDTTNSKCQVDNEKWDSEVKPTNDNWDVCTDKTGSTGDLEPELKSQSTEVEEKSENVSSSDLLTLLSSACGDGDELSQSTVSNNSRSQTPVSNVQTVSVVTDGEIELQSHNVSGGNTAGSSSNNVDNPLSCEVSTELSAVDGKEESRGHDSTGSVHHASPSQENMADSPGVQQTDSPGCDNNSEASNDSGRGGSVTETLIPPQNTENHTERYEFNFPSELCGRLIGKFGKNINYLKELSGAHISLKNNPFTPDFQICLIEGKQAEVDKALVNIRKKFPRHQFPQVDFTPLGQQQPAETPVLVPDIVQLSLPESVSVDIVISNIVDAGHIFVQQPTHPTFPSLERLNHFMMACYSQDQMVPGLPRPIEVGVICACVSGGGWYRAQIMSVIEDSDECDVKYVDYGGYARVQAPSLKQIRSDFMTLPFQAVECYMGNITPLQEEEYFSERASTILQEITEGKVLQAQVINRAEDGLPYIHIYRVGGNRVLFINRELVNHRAVRWIEILQ